MTKVKMTEMEFAGLSDIGKQRNNNEDFILFKDNLLLVADGVGGEEGGEIASKIACETIAAEFFAVLDKVKNPSVALQHAVKKANKHIFAESVRKKCRMATTLCAIYIKNNIVFYTHLGDSRIYLYRQAKIRQLTVDDKPQNKTSGEGKDAKDSSMITNALGFVENARFSIHRLYVRKNDILCAFTDGLTGPLSDIEIRDIISNADSIEDAVGQLIGEANNRGGKDNITAGLIKVEKIFRRHMNRSFFLFLPVIILSFMAAGAIYNLNRIREEQRIEQEILKGEVEAFILGEWREAWEKFSVHDILELYSSSFGDKLRDMQYEGMWDKYRAREKADIAIENISVSQESGGVRVSFVQHFQTNRFNERSLVNILLVRENGKWKVAEEREEIYEQGKT
jgi:PPM family protein phosphatase